MIPIRISSEGAADNKTGTEVPMGRFFGLRPLSDAIPPSPLTSDSEGAETFAVLAMILARLAVKPSSGREIMNRKVRHGGAKFARYKSPHSAVGNLHHDHHNIHINHSSDNISSKPPACQKALAYARAGREARSSKLVATT